jgi:manganese efflux pump family protein
MEWAALITWVVTALFGFTMLVIWLKHGGLQQRRGKIPPWLILSHFTLAASGLVVWIVYVATDADVLAWIAFAALAVVASLGWTMFFGWARRKPAGSVIPPSPPAETEPRFPLPVVALHGLFAVTTVVLVFLTAIGVGD